MYTKRTFCKTKNDIKPGLYKRSINLHKNNAYSLWCYVLAGVTFFITIHIYAVQDGMAAENSHIHECGGITANTLGKISSNH